MQGYTYMIKHPQPLPPPPHSKLNALTYSILHYFSLGFWFYGILSKGCMGKYLFHISYVSHSVKQSGIISPVLFNAYMDDLSCVLNCSKIGGRIGGEIVNHLSYADDLCLICLSSASMQKLLNVCSKYATEHTCSLSYIMQTSHILCFLKLPQ